MAQEQNIEQTITVLIQFSKKDLNRLNIESYHNYNCEIFEIYNQSALNINNSKIVKSLNRRNKKTDDPIDEIIQNLPKTIKKTNDYICCKVPYSLNIIIADQLRTVEKNFYNHEKQKQKEIILNFGKGPKAWTTRNIILPIKGICHYLINGEILYQLDKKYLKEKLSRELDNCYRESLIDLKITFTDLMIARYFRESEEFPIIQKRELTSKL